MRRRVAFIDYFPTHYRRGLYEELARRMEVDFYFFSDERERWQSRAISAAHGGDYRRVDLRRMRGAGQAFTPGTALTLSPKRYDAVIKSLNGKIMLPLTYATAKARGVPFVLWTGMWHHPTTHVHRLSRPLTTGVYRGAEAIVAYGEHVKRFLTAHRDVAGNKVFVAGQAVDPTRFEGTSPQGDGSCEVLFVGQFKAYKGVLELLRSFSAIEGAGARLRLIGSGPLEREARAHAARDERVEIVGHLPQDALPAELARARCLVLPSVTTELDREPWGLVVNEAMHAGVPVIASSAVGAAAGGLVRHEGNGLVFPERDEQALTAALERLIAEPALAARMGAQGREDVRAFDYQRMASGFERAVDHAVEAPR